eukprot:GAHX01001540.1.p1 GENE.GAHX01001540.1~~GAHX01001540.1.p1  ORF type:complete len:758 (-),score=141.62 GAHX01001540.1:218-2491(-)
MNNKEDITSVQVADDGGITDILQLLKEKSFLDKTALYARLMIKGGRHFFIRPRRFGKTLLLEALDKIACGPEFRPYFINTSICRIPLKDAKGNFMTNDKELTDIPEKYNWPKYPVMRFSFLGMMDNNSIKNILENYKNQLIEIGNRYDLKKINQDIDREVEIITNRYYPDGIQNQTSTEQIDKDLIQKLTNLMADIIKALVKLGNNYKDKVVILIDEFDAIFSSKLIKKKVNKRNELDNFVQKFYQIFKENNNLIHLKFITGVTMLRIDKLQSPLLDTTFTTTSPGYAALVGYTEEEIMELFSDKLFINLYKGEIERKLGDKTNKSANKFFLTNTLPKKNSYTPSEIKTIKKEILVALTQWYDGYRFTNDKTRIFNPTSVNLCFGNSTYDYYWNYTTENDFKWNMLRKNISFFRNLEITGEEKEVKTHLLCATKSKCKTSKEKCIAFLFQTGLLTIKYSESTTSDGYTYTLGFPNNEIRQSYAEAVNCLTRQLYKAKFFGLAKQCHNSFKNEVWKEFSMCVYGAFRKVLFGGSEDVQEHNFKYNFHMLMLASEIELENEKMNGFYATTNRNYIFEYKAKPYLFGPQTKFKGSEQAYYIYYPLLTDHSKDTVIIGMNFLRKKKEGQDKPRSYDINDDKHLSMRDLRNTCNIGQFIITRLNKDGSEKYKTEIIPNGTNEPFVNDIEVSNENWNEKAKEYNKKLGANRKVNATLEISHNQKIMEKNLKEKELQLKKMEEELSTREKTLNKKIKKMLNKKE